MVNNYSIYIKMSTQVSNNIAACKIMYLKQAVSYGQTQNHQNHLAVKHQRAHNTV